ncbi:dickkopf-related protein 3-like [Oxyura jamaicensis]|uniref:dickkopf-related protein 3-like n=1 Tax=Oxyura jamaicensis TaxID=8884 RepID=UPI0015A70E59|nr:dickkopf-related protein 3-like [Oxyura jamaicensis]XP_035203402.1 dickkopf-related protein 3-like [Oxyura jamaicensis]
MQPALALLCLGATLLPAASGHLWAWMYSLPRHPPDEAALGRRAGPGDNLEEVTACGPASPCAQGHFCDEHFGLCLPTRPAGQYCRRDAHCAHGLLCMFGKCQQPAADGQEGARCHRDEDCGPGGCCARRHGERVCQQRLAPGQGCHVPPGGLAFSINQVCPCQAGLVCRASAPPRE